MRVDLDEYFPPNSSAVAVVLDNQYLDRVGAALDTADKNVSKAISNDDYDALKKAVSEGQENVDEAIES